jgi:hypothetical protein
VVFSQGKNLNGRQTGFYIFSGWKNYCAARQILTSQKFRWIRKISWSCIFTATPKRMGSGTDRLKLFVETSQNLRRQTGLGLKKCDDREARKLLVSGTEIYHEILSVFRR